MIILTTQDVPVGAQLVGRLMLGSNTSIVNVPFLNYSRLHLSDFPAGKWYVVSIHSIRKGCCFTDSNSFITYKPC